jgi:hypothetical protein
MMITLLLLAQDARSILDAYEKARPKEADLQIHRIDWVPTLKDALAAAEKDARPIFVIATTQLEDAGSLVTGHC